VGTPLYAAPEQASTGQVDARTDVFSLGAIAYTLLAGHPAFADGSIPKIVERVLRHDPPPPSRVVPGIPVYLDRVIGRAMAKEPDHRYPDALTLAEDLEDVLAGRPPSHASEAARIAAVGTWPLPPKTTPGTEPVEVEPIEVELVEAPDDPLESAFHALVAGAPGPQETPAAGAAGPGVSLTPASTIASARVPGRRRRATLVGGTLVLAGFAIGYVALRLRDAPAEPSPRPAPTTLGTPTKLGAPINAPSASPSPAAADRTPTPDAPPPRVQPSAIPALSAREAGHIRIDFNHPLKAGVLRVWVDGAQVIHEKISGTVHKKGLVFKVAQGTFRDSLEVSPGVHTVRFQVAWDDNVKAEEIKGTFAAGETKTLAADLGRMRKGLDLEWK
jgi:hypothetical protein